MSNNTHSYKTFAFREEIGLDLEGGAGIVEDGRFGKCANLPDQTARLAPQENLSALGLDKPNFSLSIWVHLNAGQNSFSLGTATAKLRVDGEGAKLVSDDNPVADFPNADFPAGHWHYLAWVKTGDKHGLYLDGIKVGVKEASLAWSANDTLELALGNPGGRAAHLKCYPRALSEAEVLADYYTEVPTATESFVEQYPVDLAIANMAGPWEGYPDNKLFIVDDADNKVRQKIVLTNASGKAISLNATGKPDAAKDNLHFELRFRNATFSEPATYPKFDAPDGWSIQGPQQNSEDGSWSVYILSNSQRTLAADETLEFPFEYVTADSALGSRGTQVSLHYRNLAYDGGDPITGNRNKQVDILKVSATGGEFPLVALHEAPAGVVCDQECGQLHFYLYNRSDRTLTFSDNAEFRFVVPTGGGAGDLATDHTKTGRGADPLKKDTNASDGSSIFRWKPGANTEIQSGETVTLGITGCTPNAHPGVAIIDVEYQGLEGYPDGKLVAPVTKTTRDLAKLAGGGNVGIGTTDPSSALEIVSGRPNGIHVRGNVDKKVEPAVSTYLTLESEDDYRGRGVFLSHGSTSDGSKAAWFVGAPYKGGGLQVGYYSGSNSIYASAYKEQAKLFLTKEGNVGIGTTDPSKRLHVRENATDHAAIIENAAAGGYGLIVSAENDPLRVGGKDDPTGQSLIVKGDGKVGIGTTAPAEKLDVRGKLILGNDANEDLLTFRSERSWKFTAGGDGSGTSLDLQSLTNDKSFRILSPGGEAPLAVHVSDASDKSRVALGADLHVAKGRKIRIGDTKIDEDDLKILKKLASSKLTVQIKSGHGKYLDNYHGKANEGDNNRTIQFANSSAKGNWSLMTLIVSSG
uniref:Concanavalin A-like lectin/glucanases superfamily protein n=1 Tax=Candidatus Kentrum sp. SD TaxID=2126332 RepID=A0A450YCB9_9GAMM|nr:MAG: Concanavalin A-like lectin/glucanases superfamily protein [Candidatus Kentron sp. SD]